MLPVPAYAVDIRVGKVYICLCLPPDRILTKVKWPEGRIWVGVRGVEGRVRAEARVLLYYACHRPTRSNVGQMCLVGHGPKHGSSQRCLIIALTWQRSPVLYKGVKCVNNAARLPKGLPLSIGHPAQIPDSTLKILCAKHIG